MHFRKINNLREIFFDETINTDKDGNQQTMADVFRDPVNIEDLTERRLESQKLYRYINAELDTREKDIIVRRYGLLHKNGSGEICAEKSMTQQEVADNLEISRSYVYHIAYCKDAVISLVYHKSLNLSRIIALKIKQI